MKASTLSRELGDIKNFNAFGCIEYSTHSIEQMKIRGISQSDIKRIIARNDTYIIQYHEPNTYRNNPYPVFVLYGKLYRNGKKKPIHVVIAKNQSYIGGLHYTIVTTYEPSSMLFKAYGRVYCPK